ncbi:uncharacterized protein [Dysidea avara]|uniref:uncharacterized protein n=1 Tax=Dysidea avara TaxID=196820 RepID=UPI0033203DA1
MTNRALIFLYLLIPITWSAYRNKIIVSKQQQCTECDKVNDSLYYCQNLSQAFDLLTTCNHCNSDTDISIEPGQHGLASSHMAVNIKNVRFGSANESMSATIQCVPPHDAGLTFIGVRDLVVEHLNFIGCGTKHISTSQVKTGELVFLYSALFIQNSTNINLNNIEVSNSNGVGLLMYDTNGNITITRSQFTNNSFYLMNAGQHFIGGGGGIYIEFTRCTPGLTDCNSNENKHNSDCHYLIDNCEFRNNVAVYDLNGTDPDYLPNGASMSFSAGGGLSIWFFGQAKNNNVQITHSNFVSNTANMGGGLYVGYRQNTSNSTLFIAFCSFKYNSVGMYHGGGGVKVGYDMYQSGGKCINISVKIESCLFKRNQALNGVGGGLDMYGSHEPFNKPTNSFYIYNCSFVSNTARYGTSMQISKEFYESIAQCSLFTAVIDNCSFVHEKTETFILIASRIGTVATFGVDIQFRNFTMFKANRETALVVEGASVEFYNNSKTIFQENKGLYGGAILLTGGSWIKVFPYSTLLFQNNEAVFNGGAICVEFLSSFDHLLSHVCFVKYCLEAILPQHWQTKFTFVNNTAGQHGKTIFSYSLHPCRKFYAENSYDTFLYKEPFYHHTLTEDAISTSPSRFTNIQNISTIPGKVFDLHLELVDELGCDVNGTLYIATCSTSSPYVVEPYQFTSGLIQIAGRPNKICQLQIQTETNYPVNTMMYVVLKNCPPGWEYDDTKQQCDCIKSPTDTNRVIRGCEQTTFQAYFNTFYWIGYNTDSSEARDQDLLTGPCPYRYCYQDDDSQSSLLPGDANMTILDQFVCGNRHRTGLLCGQCIDGYSVTLNSPTYTCHKCENRYLGILLFFLSYIAPVTILFCFIMAFNIRITVAPISAFLFFSQILGSQNHVGFTHSIDGNYPGALYYSDILHALYSITNLNFFNHEVFRYCLIPNAGTIDIIAFTLLTAFYPVFLITIFILFRVCCEKKRIEWWLRKLTRESIAQGICTFLVLCFAKIVLFSFKILRSAEVTYMNGTSYRHVVYFQGDIGHFQEFPYILYASAAIVSIIVVIIIPTVVLVLHPIMMATAIHFDCCENTVACIDKCLLKHKLKPIWDSFQGDYKPKLEFFAGLHFFLYRVLFYLIIVTSQNVETSLLLILMFLVLISLIHMLSMPLKSYVDNSAYSLVYILLLAIVMMEYYLFVSNKSAVVAWLIAILSLLPLLGCIMYCCWKLYLSWKRRGYQELQNLANLPQAGHQDTGL